MDLTRCPLQREERLRIVKPPTPEADAETAANTPSFVFPEVQEAMKGAEQLDPKGACVL